MSASLWIRFSIMMLLQYWIWGAWGAYLPIYLGEQGLGFSGTEVGTIMTIFYVAFIFAPLLGGQITDRFLSSEKFLGISQIICGVLMYYLVSISDFYGFLMMMFIWSFFYAPTIPLTNTICFQNIENVERDFGRIRIWGTLGWIFSGWALTFWLTIDPDGANCLRLSAIGSIALGIFSFFLPHTPPKKEGGKSLAFLDALVMLKDPVFLTFSIISFVVATELMFYYVLTGPFLVDIGIDQERVPFWMSMAQIGEIVTLLVLLPWILPKVGIKQAILIGIIAWPVRYIIFAIGGPQWLILASLPLHGLCYVFFFVVGQIYVDKIAPKDIRNSAQSLLAMITFGFGLSVGGVFAGWIQDLFTSEAADGTMSVAWTPVFIIPVVITIVCAIVFVYVFKEPKENKEANESA